MAILLLRFLFPPGSTAPRDASRRRRADLRWLAMAAAIYLGVTIALTSA